MTSRSLAELHLIRTGNPLRTIELDIDSLPADAYGYADLVHSALTPFAEDNPELRATVYVSHKPSINFGRPAYCAFFGVAGDQRALKALFDCFGKITGLKIRYSEDISESQALQQYQIEGGKLWYPDDGDTWRAEGGDDDGSVQSGHEDTSDGGSDDDDNASASTSDHDPSTSGSTNPRRAETPSRFRAARSDASVGTISRRIEATFGLPEGSVVLRGPDKKILRSDATVRTLRRRWE